MASEPDNQSNDRVQGNDGMQGLEPYKAERDDLLLHQRVGELTGRVHAVETHQQNLNAHLTRIEGQLTALAKRINIFAGAVSVLVSLASFGGWYMAFAGIAPLDAARTDHDESAQHYSVPDERDEGDRRTPRDGGTQP